MNNKKMTTANPNLRALMQSGLKSTDTAVNAEKKITKLVHLGFSYERGGVDADRKLSHFFG